MAKQPLDAGIIPRENLMAIIKYVGGGLAVLAFGIFSINYFIPRVPPATPERIRVIDAEAALQQLTPAKDCSASPLAVRPGLWFDQQPNLERCYEGTQLNALNVPTIRAFRLVRQNTSRDATLTITQRRAQPGFATSLIQLTEQLPGLKLTEKDGVNVYKIEKVSTIAVEYAAFSREQGGHGMAFTYHESPIPMASSSELGYRNAVIGIYYDASRDKPFGRDEMMQLFSDLQIQVNPTQ